MSERYLADPLQQLTHAYKAHLLCIARQAGIALPGTHLRVLKGIDRLQPAATAQGLAQQLRRDKAQITRVLAELVIGGWVLRRHNPADGRSQLLELSTAGAGLLHQLAELEARTQARMTQGLSAEALEGFVALARQMADNLNASE